MIPLLLLYLVSGKWQILNYKKHTASKGGQEWILAAAVI